MGVALPQSQYGHKSPKGYGSRRSLDPQYEIEEEEHTKHKPNNQRTTVAVR